MSVPASTRTSKPEKATAITPHPLLGESDLIVTGTIATCSRRPIERNRHRHQRSVRDAIPLDAQNASSDCDDRS